ncbi:MULTISPECIES: endonuclease/exonuclease/phosphatase family protein [unclassified Pseudomonas]|uniref:endonuclease/exonuclease/phosphatase family protein n=1 Tax=unclassified Pseudomonas TaxID=196821 RepID=UPI000D38CBF4|nr:MULTISPECIES: endonuclease/exonuclease/phosphatase family protein [unclassified Pseudomonas]RAU44656.1 endonuclease [Pseudomonas sp. RIT 409]RAU54908.1 endonuclease [Pseudomonas sp. RIT 412]
MPIRSTIRDYIDQHLLTLDGFNSFETQLEVVITDIVQLASSSPEDARHNAAYLTYTLSFHYMRSANEPMQCQLAQTLTSLFSRLYNDAGFISLISRVRPQGTFPVLLSFYHLHHSFIMNGLRAPHGPMALDHADALRMLQIIVGAAYGPWMSRIQLQGALRDYHHARVINDAQGTRIEVGRSSTGTPRTLSLATWNMQGSSEATDTKWRTFVLALARENAIVMLQEAGQPPASAAHVADHFPQDQFGNTLRVSHYLWQAGSTTRGEQYQIFFLDVQRLRVNLAILVASGSDIEAVSPVVVSDGLPTANDAPSYRPALGVEIRWRNAPRHTVTAFNFHAISNGGSNAPRMLREVSWHTPTRFVMAGDFNRDPRPTTAQGNWISPPELAQLALPASETHPSTQPASMLDYAVSNGTIDPVATGRVSAAGPSDHLAASFEFSFPL